MLLNYNEPRAAPGTERPEDSETMAVFTVGGQPYAVPVSAVERVISAVEITPVPQTPVVVLGVINLHGTIIPVVDIRLRLRLPPKEVDCTDLFLIVRTKRSIMALTADHVNGIRDVRGDRIENIGETLPFSEYLRGAVQLDDGLVLIYDLDQFLSPEEERTLGEALERSER